ncbi:hypothetical protein Enr13x_08630 [Stieleria neptunia]|uniref:Uncharacterized protein n=1 Tax=Stieleria neptunia TaxID=2527979 RepID=A0A518HJJ3_9BACT|nr:hypothetical protein [Stieleria neptunia]QDV41025.1 hypothetical protein Enr13x_08630 [Stieleria neptunia]
MIRSRFLCSLLLVLLPFAAAASDHADPIDVLNRQRQERALTDLFVFPVKADGTPAFPFEREAKLPLHDPLADVVREPLSDEQRRQIDSLVFILCVRRQLTDSTTLKLEPYTYKINIDYHSLVKFPKRTDADPNSEAGASSATAPPTAPTADDHGHAHTKNKLSIVEAFARYGGSIPHPEKIKEDIVIEFRLNDDGRLQPGYPRFSQPKNLDVDLRPDAGIHDDPFIFPAFFGTNIVAMQVRLPISVFPNDRTNFLIWATSHKGSGGPIDHVGRSLRTQNPRFELLNTLHPSRHVAAITEEHNHPSLMRDILLRLNFGSLFAYRSWDFVPDVMCYSTIYPVGFPNGRLLTDDVAAILAQHGDTLLYELSFQDDRYRWPRQTTNDGRSDGSETFLSKAPYLLPANPQRAQPPPLRLSTASIVKLTLIVIALLSLWALSLWLFARWYYRRQIRRRYL